MIGAIVGDIAGSRFEFRNRKTKELSLLVGRGEEERHCYFTDDTVMTLAVAQAILDCRSSGSSDMADLSAAAVRRLQEFGLCYPHAGYGGAFRRWLEESRPRPYNSWGNGAAICGAVAEAFYGVPNEIRDKGLTFLSQHLADVLKRVEANFCQEGEC